MGRLVLSALPNVCPTRIASGVSESSAEEQDRRIRGQVHLITEVEREGWDSPDRKRGDLAHGLFQYPGMMVPSVQRIIADAVFGFDSSISSVFDPFVGAGTSLVSTMHRGTDCYGQDINPLAVLLAKTRTGPGYAGSMPDRMNDVLALAREDSSDAIEADFPRRTKWFRDDVAIALSRLRRAIRAEGDLWARRFFWVALAETVRLTSNDRTSTYKLHARPQTEVEGRDLAPIEMFEGVLRENLIGMQAFWKLLEENGCLADRCYAGRAEIVLGDTTASVRGSCGGAALYDLLITSPPYGDNASTVPYGQHSYLPLQWIDLADIDEHVDPRALRTTQETDRRSIGGRTVHAKDIKEEGRRLGDISPAIRSTLKALEDKPHDRAARVIAFSRDLVRALVQIVPAMRPNAYMIWTIGNRRVGGIEIPNDEILSELLQSSGVIKVTEVERQIRFKRMAARNRITTTMSKERIVIFRKEDADSHG